MVTQSNSACWFLSLKASLGITKKTPLSNPVPYLIKKTKRKGNDRWVHPIWYASTFLTDSYDLTCKYRFRGLFDRSISSVTCYADFISESLCVCMCRIPQTPQIEDC